MRMGDNVIAFKKGKLVGKEENTGDNSSSEHPLYMMLTATLSTIASLSHSEIKRREREDFLTGSPFATNPACSEKKTKSGQVTPPPPKIKKSH